MTPGSDMVGTCVVGIVVGVGVGVGVGIRIVVIPGTTQGITLPDVVVVAAARVGKYVAVDVAADGVDPIVCW